jgi:hypothetical protein
VTSVVPTWAALVSEALAVGHTDLYHKRRVSCIDKNEQAIPVPACIY